MRLITIAVVAACSALRLCATEYYVDYAGGADTNRGTSVYSAWKHCPGDPAASGSAAAVSLRPGDVVRFKGGVTYGLTNGGIVLQWDGATSAPITYDGNGDNAWGAGRARISANGALADTGAFTAATFRQNLIFTNLELAGIGGRPQLPPDGGAPMTSRFGAGLQFTGGARGITVERCHFTELGYWFNTRPMDAASIAGAGIQATSLENSRVVDCDFSRVASGIDLSEAASLDNITVTNCRFGSAVLWPFDLPNIPGAANALNVSGCTAVSDQWFEAGNWRGYGEAPGTAFARVDEGATVTWTVSAIAAPSPTFQWYRNGIPLPGATSATLRLDNVSAVHAGTYTAVASNSAGTTVSNRAVLEVTSSGAPTPPVPDSPRDAPLAAPEFLQHPASAFVSSYENVTLTAVATGTPAPLFQWYRDRMRLDGATDASLQLFSVTAEDAGNYTVVATNQAGTAISQAATVTVVSPPPPPPPQEPTLPDTTNSPRDPTPAPENPTPTPQPETPGTFAMLAVNMTQVSAAPATLEFTVPGSTPQRVLVRAVGPMLDMFRIGGALANPYLEVYHDGVKIAENDDWGGTDELRSAMTLLSVFPLVYGDSADAAMILTLPAGTSTLVVRGADGGMGTVWLDAYTLP